MTCYLLWLKLVEKLVFRKLARLPKKHFLASSNQSAARSMLTVFSLGHSERISVWTRKWEHYKWFYIKYRPESDKKIECGVFKSMQSGNDEKVLSQDSIIAHFRAYRCFGQFLVREERFPLHSKPHQQKSRAQLAHVMQTLELQVSSS